jgi:hypothetical protein
MGHLLKIKCVDSRVSVHILASTIVPFTLTTVQVPNLALTHTKRITVYFVHLKKKACPVPLSDAAQSSMMSG